MSTARVVIKGEDQLRGPLKQAQNELTGFESVASKVGNTLKNAFTVAAIVKGIQELSKAVSACVDEFKEGIEVETRLNAIIKATDQQYKYTTRDIKEFASALQEQTRFADDAVTSSASLLVATQKFSKEGLERTLELSADLAEAMGTDITSATQTLSKALIEPGEGLTRLRSIGISFTDSEEKMIETLRAAGDELGAQQVILDKVEKAYGGVAKSVASIDTSTLDKIKMVWSDIKEDLGEFFTNALGPVFNWIYETLRWFERKLNQLNQRADFNKALSDNDVQSLADNFTPEYLQAQLEKRDYDNIFQSLKEDWKDIWADIWADSETSMEEFIQWERESQIDYLRALYPDNYMRVDAFLGELNFLNEPLRILEAIQKQEEDQFKWEQQEAKKTELNNAAIASKGMGDTFAKATENAIYSYFSDNPITVGGITGTSIGNTTMKGYFGTGISDSTYMSTMYGDIGMWAQTTQAFMETFYDWETDFDVFVRKFGEPDRQSGLGFNFGVASPEFNLPKIVTDLTDTMSILGPENVRKYLDFGDQKLQDALKAYGSYSESYQADLLQQNIEGIQNILDTLIEPGTSLYTYFEEILRSLKSRQSSSSSGASSGSGNGMYEWGENFKADMEELDSQIQTTLFEDFKSQLGEAGDLIDRLGKNMAQFGPLIGAIVTALHYVIQGFVEQIGPLLEDFVTWGLEPLREFGRMIGQILTPILQEIMPSVVASGKVLMNLFQSLSRLLTPIVETLMRVIGPVLSVLADVLVSIVGTISWAIDWLAYAITWVLNKITFGWVEQTANPGGLNDYLSGMYADPTSTYTGSSNGMNSTGLQSASYTGGTVVHLNIYNYGNVVGSNGFEEFAVSIRDALVDIGYLGR